MSGEWGWALRCALYSASLGVGVSSISLFAAYHWLCRGGVSKENRRQAVLLFLITKKEWEDQKMQGEEPK